MFLTSCIRFKSLTNVINQNGQYLVAAPGHGVDAHVDQVHDSPAAALAAGEDLAHVGDHVQEGVVAGGALHRSWSWNDLELRVEESTLFILMMITFDQIVP